MCKIILAVDDQEVMRLLIRLAAEECGHEVVEARDGLEALALLQSGRPPDLMVLDLVMPNLDGNGVLRAMRAGQLTCYCPVLVISGFLHDLEFAPEWPIVGVLPKPMTAQELKAGIEQALAVGCWPGTGEFMNLRKETKHE